MKKLLLFLTLSLALTTLRASAQNAEYRKLITEAEMLYDNKNYQSSGQTYAKAFAVNNGMGSAYDRYNAACSWSLAGNADSAFAQLQRAATKGNYTDLNHLQNDPDLKSLYADKRWKEVVAQVKKNKDKAEEHLDRSLIAMLDNVMEDDQKYRRQLDQVEEKYGRDSKEMKELWKKIEETDSINLIIVKGILDKYGWLGPDVIGARRNQALFLVIQHADIKTQEKYLPMMREAVKNKKASPSALALLEDRVALRTGKKQIYGSQIGRFQNGKYYVSPLEDPDNVDQRRASVGLEPLSAYISHWQLTWDAAAYKKALPAIEAHEKKIAEK